MEEKKRKQKSKYNWIGWTIYILFAILSFILLYKYTFPSIETQFKRGNFRSKYQGKISSRRKTN